MYFLVEENVDVVKLSSKKGTIAIENFFSFIDRPLRWGGFFCSFSYDVKSIEIFGNGEVTAEDFFCLH